MRRFVLGWKKLGLEQSLGTRLVTYGLDLSITFDASEQAVVAGERFDAPV